MQSTSAVDGSMENRGLSAFTVCLENANAKTVVGYDIIFNGNM
jgi:hypothetical protein